MLTRVFLDHPRKVDESYVGRQSLIKEVITHYDNEGHDFAQYDNDGDGFIDYFVIGSLMEAIGAAVNETREAQSFMMPIMIVMMIPWMLWLPITRDPNSVFATVTSFLPPINSFVMLLGKPD